MPFNDKIDHKYYYHNCKCNYLKICQILNFVEYNIIAKLGIIYIYIIKYFNLFIFYKCSNFLIVNLTRDL